MEIIDDQVIRSICPWLSFQFVFRPSIGAYGGILLVSNDACWQKMDKFVRRFFVSALLKYIRCGLLPCMGIIMIIIRLIVE